MMLKELKGLAMGKTWLSYVGSAWGVLTHAGLWEGDIADLAGCSGLAFAFVVHETACPSSTTVYDWGVTHFQAMDRIGVYTDGLLAAVNPGLNTGDELQAEAVAKIKEAVDRGRGVVVWAPTSVLEFGIVTGYDDDERIFSVVDCVNPDPDPLLYDNLGRAEVPMLYIQRFHSRKEVDREKLYRDAFAHGVRLWRSEHRDRRYGSGPKAYDNFIHTLKAGDYNPFGASYCLQVYADAKRMLAALFKKAAAEGAPSGMSAGVSASAARYERIAALFREMADAVPFRGPKDTKVEADKIPQLLKNLKECRRLESESLDELGGLLNIETTGPA